MQHLFLTVNESPLDVI